MQLDRLAGRAPGGDRSDELTALLEGLRTALLQLRVTQGELERQSAELAESRRTIESERRLYEDLFELAPDAYVVTDGLGKILEANAAATQLLQRPTRFLIGKPLAELVTPASRRAFLQARVQAGVETAGTLELGFSPHGAPERAVSATFSAHPHATGRTVRWILRDVTVERGRELELRVLSEELEARVDARTQELEALIDHLPVGVVLVEAPSGRVVRSNASAREISARARGQDTLAELDIDLYAPDGTLLERERLPSLRAFRGETVIRETVSLERADGEARTLEVSAAPVVVDGRVQSAVVVFQDVTDRERRASAVRAFVANAAHEIGTPLAGILAAVEALKAGAKDVPADRDHFLAHVESESLRLSRLARALLVLARAQARDESAPLEIVPLAPLVADVAGVVDAKPGVRVDVSCPFDAAAVANRPLLEQALVNLAGNAARYTEEGEIRLTVASENGMVAVTVADTGPGIPDDVRERLFERFTRSASGAGFGLGLAIARDSIEATHGTLAIETEPGAGTRAIVRLPAARLVAS